MTTFSTNNLLDSSRNKVKFKTNAAENQKQLINFSVRAQDFLLRQSFKNLDDISFLESTKKGGEGGFNASADSTVASQNLTNEASIIKKSRFGGTSSDPLGLLQLPKINAGNPISPFRGMIDISITTKKLQQSFDLKKIMRGNHSVKGSIGVGDYDSKQKDNFVKEANFEEQQKLIAYSNRGKTHSRERASNRMNPKVLETWINTTLQDAEHLDIPGVILKSEHKTPVTRYGIGRLDFQAAGLDEPTIDRVYRALFVYSVGFYELLEKCLEHTKQKYSTIVSIWKVFSILLEYCCRADYRMMISKVVQDSEEEKQKQKEWFEEKFQDQANNEKLLKQTIENLQKFNETLEKERVQERNQRLKLEDEYQQNSKNHEEEVQLRLKFEQKLNNMHSAHRDLETRYKRVKQDYVTAYEQKNYYQEQVNIKIDELTLVKTQKTEIETKIRNLQDRCDGLERDLQVRSDQIEEKDKQIEKLNEQLDELRYKFSDQYKEITELKLKSDVLLSVNSGLTGEKEHLTIELKETRKLQFSYEKRSGDLIIQLNQLNHDHQELQKRIIGSDELAKEREERIQKLKEELAVLKDKFEQTDIAYGNLKIGHLKIVEEHETCKNDLADTVEKLHLTNKVRHETEVKLGDEIEKTQSLQEIIRLKDDTLSKRGSEIEKLDKELINLQGKFDQLEIKLKTQESKYSDEKAQSKLKESNLNEIINNEKDSSSKWVQRFEQEQREHQNTNSLLLKAKSDLKDQELATKNAVIQQQSTEKQLVHARIQISELQQNMNETNSKIEDLEREVCTQQEVLKQFEISKKEYIAKLRRELETVEERFKQTLHQNIMEGEDYRSYAYQYLQEYLQNVEKVSQLDLQLNIQTELAKEKTGQVDNLLKKEQENQMEWEDQNCQIVYKTEVIDQLRYELEEHQREIQNLEKDKSQLQQEIEAQNNQIKQLDETILDSQNNLEKSNDQLMQKLMDANELNKELEQKSQNLLKRLETERRISEFKLQKEQKSVEKAQKETQTNIGMEYFDKQIQRKDSHHSGQTSQNSNKVKVGGGGTIAKPPKQNNRVQQPNLDLQMNLNGTQIANNDELQKESRESGGSKNSKQNNGAGQVSLPNLLRNQFQSISQITGEHDGKLNSSRLNAANRDGTNQETIQTNNQELGKLGYSALGTLMNTLPQNLDPSIIPLDNGRNLIDQTISDQETQFKAGQQSIVIDQINTDHRYDNVIPEEDENLHGESAFENVITQQNIKQSKQQSSKQSQQMKLPVSHTGFISPMNHINFQNKIISDKALSQHSQSRIKMNSGTSYINPPQPNFDDKSQQMNAETITKINSSRNDSRMQSGENFGQIEIENMTARQQQMYQSYNRMKVNINNPEKISNDQSYQGQAASQTQNNIIMAPQMTHEELKQQANPQNQGNNRIQNKKVTGTSSIRSLIKLAASRD